jgi:hypothetical protein
VNFWKRPKNLPENGEDLSSQTTQAEVRNYVNEEYRLSFTVPEGAKLYTAENPGPLKNRFSVETPIILINPEFTEENINVKVAENISTSDLVEFKDMLDKNPNMPLPKYRNVSINFCKIGVKKDKTAVEHIYFMKGNIFGKIRQITTQHNGRGFTFTCSTSEERFDTANRSFFNTLFDSMEFTQLLDPGLLKMVPLSEWSSTPLAKAEERLIEKLQSPGHGHFFLGPHPDPHRKEGFCFLGGDFIEATDSLPPALKSMSEQINGKKAVLSEIFKFANNQSTQTGITQIGEIAGDSEHLALKTSNEITVIVDRVLFDFLYARHHSSKVLLIIPQRTVGFIGNEGNDGLLVPTKK